MIFTPKPENDFADFIDIYYKECRKRFPKIEAMAAKWTFEDLIPGLSDFDTRFICANDMTAEDWCDMSSAVGAAHLEICRSHPQWSRILEHLPGVNLTWNELVDDFSYYPEYLQWSFYRCQDEEKLENTCKSLYERKWEARDEYFNLKKFLLYYGPYVRSIDPAVNLGAYENKYPLHSRTMHYFNPPVQSAVSIIEKRNVRGKMEAFRLAARIFPQIPVFVKLMDLVNKHYEVPSLYEDPHLSAFEEELHEALNLIWEELKDHVTLIPEEKRCSVKGWKEALNNVPIPPQLIIFDNSKFSRLMKGRLLFYANVPEHFSSKWLISNELRRLGNSFYRTPYKTFWKITHHEDVDNVDEIIPRLVPEILTPQECEATLEFSRLTPGVWEDGTEVELANRIAAVFDHFFKGLYKILTIVKSLNER
jgi:hypothetical protein